MCSRRAWRGRWRRTRADCRLRRCAILRWPGCLRCPPRLSCPEFCTGSSAGSRRRHLTLPALCFVEAVAQGEEGWLGHVVRVEGERPLLAIGMLYSPFGSVEPGVCIADSPGEDGFDFFTFEHAAGEVAIDAADLLVAGCGVVGVEAVVL